MNRLIEHLQFQIMQNEDVIENLGLTDTESLMEKEDIDYLKDENKYYEKVINKLKSLQALEEELGISLPILFNAWKNGIYTKNIGFLQKVQVTYLELENEYAFIYGYYAIRFKDYGKSWWLKEDLKSE